jgi:GTP-binding protein HflX
MSKGNRPLIPTAPPAERAVLVGAPRRGTREARQAEDHLDELARLADTGGTQVVGRLLQFVSAPNPGSYLGHGKLEELARLVRDRDATLVLFDEDLSPAQGKTLEQALTCRVMDRSELILAIFALRARTREARLQVEYAQLEYLLPRLQRMWVHLSRIRGGIGLRGPGETQLETDRRMIRRRMGAIRRKLADVERHRRVLRSGRRAVATAALVGYTNAGKSSLLRALTGARVFVEDRLFATLDTKAREASVDGGRRIRLIDTVGFIRKLPHHLVASFRATLEEAREADVLLHVIDAAHPDWEEQVEVVDEVLADVVPPATPVIHVFNKMDRVSEGAAFRSSVAARFERVAFGSAARGEVDDLVAALDSVTRRELAGPPSRGFPSGFPSE